MPGTIVEDVELIDAGRGGGNPPPAGGDDDGDSGGSSRKPVPRRAYFTALQLGLAAIVMFRTRDMGGGIPSMMIFRSAMISAATGLNS